MQPVVEISWEITYRGILRRSCLGPTRLGDWKLRWVYKYKTNYPGTTGPYWGEEHYSGFMQQKGLNAGIYR